MAVVQLTNTNAHTVWQLPVPACAVYAVDVVKLQLNASLCPSTVQCNMASTSHHMFLLGDEIGLSPYHRFAQICKYKYNCQKHKI